MRAVCKNALEGIRKGASNCPLILSKLTFNVFSHYLITPKKQKREVSLKIGVFWNSECSDAHVPYEW